MSKRMKSERLCTLFLCTPRYKPPRAVYEVEFLYLNSLTDCGIYSFETRQNSHVSGKGFYVPERVLSTELQPFRGSLYYTVTSFIYKT